MRAVRTIQYNNLLFYSLFIIYNIYYIIFIIYYSSDSPSSLITESLSVTQSLSSLSSPSSSHWMSSSDPSKVLFMQLFLKDLTIMLSGMAFRAAHNHRATSEGGWRKGADWNRELTFFFSFKKSAKTGADWIRMRIGFENIRYLRCFLKMALDSQIV